MTSAKAQLRAFAARQFRKFGLTRLLILVAILPPVIFMVLITLQHHLA